MPLSVPVKTILENKGSFKLEEKLKVSNGDLSNSAIMGDYDNDGLDSYIFSSGGHKAYITLKDNDNNAASSKKFAVNVSNGKIKVENIDLYTDNPSGAAPDDATENNITPGLYDVYMTFVAA